MYNAYVIYIKRAQTKQGKLVNAQKQQNVTAIVQNYTVTLLMSIWGEDNDFYCDAGNA